MQKLDLYENELGVLLHDFWNEFNNRQIVVHNIDNDLAEMNDI